MSLMLICTFVIYTPVVCNVVHVLANLCAAMLPQPGWGRGSAHYGFEVAPENWQTHMDLQTKSHDSMCVSELL